MTDQWTRFQRERNPRLEALMERVDREGFENVGEPVVDTKWVATMPTADGMTIHAEGTKEEIDNLVAVLALEQPDQEVTVEEVPATWDCDGRDNCRVVG